MMKLNQPPGQMQLTMQKLTLVACLCVSIASSIYLYAIAYYSLNIPIHDDYDAVLGFLHRYLSAHSPIEKLNAVFEQHNEHRLVLNHLIELIDLQLFGQIDFEHLIYIGNTCGFLLIYLLWRYAKSYKISFTQFSPVIILLLCFSAAEIMTFATPAIQFHLNMLFVILTFIMMTSRHPIATIFYMLLSVFSSGGGLVCLPIVNLYYFSQKQWRHLLLSSLCSLAILYIYFVFFSYSPPGNNPNILNAISHPILLTTFYFSLLGGIGFIYQLGLSLTIALGFLFNLLFLKCSAQLLKHSPALFWLGLFILLSALTASITRSGFGLEYSLSSRYSYLGLLLLSILYLGALQSICSPIKKQVFVIASLMLAVSLFAYWYASGISALDGLAKDLQTPDYRYPNQEKAIQILEDAQALKIYRADWLNQSTPP